MKGFLQKLFARRKKETQSEDWRKTTKTISLLIQEETFDIFHSRAISFIEEPVNYLIPAVWGIKKDGELTPEQQEIGNRVQILTEKVIAALDVKDLNSSQRFAVGFLVRELIIARLLLFIQIFRGQLLAETGGQEEANILRHLDVWGAA